MCHMRRRSLEQRQELACVGGWVDFGEGGWLGGYEREKERERARARARERERERACVCMCVCVCVCVCLCVYVSVCLLKPRTHRGVPYQWQG